MSTIAATNSLFEIDAELDSLLDEIEEQAAQGGEPSGELVARFQQFCSAHDEKVDRIGRFLRRMEAREQFCRGCVWQVVLAHFGRLMWPTLGTLGFRG